jgi:hypothetical protein
VPDYFYLSFGLRIRSEIECEQLLPGIGPAEVCIRVGEVPEFLPEPTFQGFLYQVAPGKLLLKITHVARYLISGGNEILVQPASGADLDEIRLFLLGSALGALLHQRGVLAIHASAVTTPHGAVAFAGLSGAGKSTLAGAFYRKGYVVLADEICAVDTAGCPRVMPAGPFLMLWADALKEMGFDGCERRAARPQLEKYILPLVDGGDAETCGLRVIYIIEPAHAELSPPIPVKGLPKIQILAQNTYRPHFVEHMNLDTEHFRRLATVAQHVPVRRVARPQGSFSQLNNLVELLEEDLLELA